MGPRVKLPRGGRQGGASSSASQPRSQPPPPQSRFAFSISGRSISNGRLVDFSFLSKENFGIARLLENQGWLYMCKTEQLVYPTLVKEFYQNLTIEGPTASSIVKRINIELNPEILGNILKVPFTGTMEDDPEHRTSKVEMIFGIQNASGMNKLEARLLNVEMRLLHHIIATTFIPRTGGFERVTERDLILMYHVLNEIPFNFPELMINVMREAITKPRGCLPYGMLLTHIFKHAGINLRNEDSHKIGHTDKYSLYSLHRMGFIKVNGEWKREVKSKEKVRSTDGDSDDNSWDTPPETSAPPPTHAPAPAPASAERMNKEDLDYIIQGLASTYPYHPQVDPSVNQYLEMLSARIDHLEKRYESLEEQHRNCSENQQAQNNELAAKMIKVLEEIAELKDNALLVGGTNMALKFEIRGIRKLVQDIRDAILPSNAFPPQPTQYQPPPTHSEAPPTVHTQTSESQPVQPDLSQTQPQASSFSDYSQQSSYNPYGQQFQQPYPYPPYGQQYQMPPMYGMPPIFAQPLQQAPPNVPSTVFESVFLQSAQGNPFRSAAPHLRRTRRRGEGSSSEPTYIIPDDEENE